ncbi:MAG: hypothetical protein AB7S38_17440 [Vulcanimicrobiota bacterium]
MDSPRPRPDPLALMVLGLLVTAAGFAGLWYSASLHPAQVRSLECGIVLPAGVWRLQVTPTGGSARCKLRDFDSENPIAEFTLTPTQLEELMARVAAEYRHDRLDDSLGWINLGPSQGNPQSTFYAWVELEKTNGSLVSLSATPETNRFVVGLLPSSVWATQAPAP